MADRCMHSRIKHACTSKYISKYFVINIYNSVPAGGMMVNWILLKFF